MKAKKIGILIAIGIVTIALIGCSLFDEERQIEKMTSLSEVLQKTTELTQQFEKKKISAEKFERLIKKLEEKTKELTSGTGGESEKEQKGSEEKILKNDTTCQIPEWAKKLGIVEPQGLNIKKDNCVVTSSSQDGFDSLFLTYEGEYNKAVQEAERIAKKANIPLSKELEMAKKALSGLSTDELNKITGGSSLKGIVYTNAGLLDTKQEYIITIAVDETGTLIIEAANYMQMKK